jgi:histone deacetylase HOS3
MSRHGRKVPVSFYSRFARDARRFAELHAEGRMLSVLEGGYSDRALMSGAFAHLVGLTGISDERVQENWWSLSNLEKVCLKIQYPWTNCLNVLNPRQLEKATKQRRAGPRKSGAGAGTGTVPGGERDSDVWITRAVDILASMDTSSAEVSVPPTRKVVPASTRVLRARSPMPRPPPTTTAKIDSAPKLAQGSPGRKAAKPTKTPGDRVPVVPQGEGADISPAADIEQSSAPAKRVPRVVLKLGPPPG